MSNKRTLAYLKACIVPISNNFNNKISIKNCILQPTNHKLMLAYAKMPHAVCNVGDFSSYYTNVTVLTFIGYYNLVPMILVRLHLLMVYTVPLYSLRFFIFFSSEKLNSSLLAMLLGTRKK